jgi:hypothetical protein
LKITHILVRNQNFEKQKKWNSKIPEPHLILLESMKYVKKSGHDVEWVIAREREEISQKFQRIWIQQAKIFLCKKIPEKLRCTVKNTPKLSLLIFRFRVKILSNEKSGIPK